MAFLEVRPETGYYDVLNGDGATWEQGRLILDDIVPVFGDVVDKDGILDAAYGKINAAVGRTIQTTQIETGVTGMLRNDPVYMAPGAGGVHDVADDRDYCIGKLIQDQGTETFLLIQTIVPFAVDSET